MNHLIWTNQNTLSSDFCQHVIEKFEQDERKGPGLVGTLGVQTNLKRSTDLNISNLLEWREEDRVFFNCLNEQLKNYEQHYNRVPGQVYYPNLGLEYEMIDSGYQIQRTLPGEFYAWHSDAWVKPPYIRTITYLWYLNDVHEDGYTEFSEGTRIQPETGKLLLFPATWTYVHRGYPPKSETKYIVTGWLSFKVCE